MTAHIELAKVIVRSTKPTVVTDDGEEYLFYSAGDVSVTLNKTTKNLIGVNFNFGPLELTYSEGEFVLLDEDEASKITSEELLEMIAEYLEWRKRLLEEFEI